MVQGHEKKRRNKPKREEKTAQKAAILCPPQVGPGKRSLVTVTRASKSLSSFSLPLRWEKGLSSLSPHSMLPGRVCAVCCGACESQ